MDRLAFLTAERTGGFAAIRGRIQAFLRDIGAEDITIEQLPDNEGPWLAGRAARVFCSMENGWAVLAKLTPQYHNLLNFLSP